MNLAGKPSSFYASTGGTPVNGAWYSGQRYLNGQLLAPGQDQPGHNVSADVIAQTDPNNVEYVNKQRQAAGLPPSPASAGAAASNSGGGTTGTTVPTTSSSLNLPDLYKKLSDAAGIPQLQQKAQAIQAQIDAITGKQNSAIATNNENPFLSEANRTGKEENINTNAQNGIEALTGNLNEVNGQITTASNNINTQLNLQTQQYQMDEQQRQDALSQFNTLMSNGLLSNLSSGDMANIATQTGLPTSVIQEAITKSAQANISPQMITTSTGVTLIDANTGNIIKSVDIPGMSSGSGAGTATQQKEDAISSMGSKIQSVANSYGNISPQQWQEALNAWLEQGFPRSEFISNFGNYADTNRGDFYQAYGFKNPNPQQ